MQPLERGMHIPQTVRRAINKNIEYSPHIL